MAKTNDDIYQQLLIVTAKVGVLEGRVEALIHSRAWAWSLATAAISAGCSAIVAWVIR